MPEQVTGQIGAESVILNNAASEATLLKLLAAVQKSGGSTAAANVAGVAKNAGIDPATVKEATDQVGGLGAGSKTTTGAVSGLGKSAKEADSSVSGFNKMANASAGALGALYSQLMSGEPSVSGTLAAFKGLPYGIGQVATLFSMVAQFQERNLAVYREITNAGANFGGSLSELRIASTKTYMTVEQFGKVVAANGNTLAKMGTTVNDGALAFVNLSQNLISSDLGRKLGALGYSTEEINQGMLNYIEVTGGRSAEELKNTKAIAQAAGEYMTELDKLTQYTGANRKQMEEEQKKAAQNAAYQRALAGMGEKERAKTEAAMAAARLSGVVGAQDALMAKVAGLPPITKEAKQFAGTLPVAYNALMDTADAAMTAGTSMEDVRKGSARYMEGVQTDVNRLGKTGDALAFGGNSVINSASLFATKLSKKGDTTAEQIGKSFDKITAQQETQAQSEADAMNAAQNQLKEFGSALMQVVAPIVGFLTPAVKYLGPALMALVGIVLLTKTTMALYQAAMAAKAVVGAAGGGVKGAAGALMDRITGRGPAAATTPGVTPPGGTVPTPPGSDKLAAAKQPAGGGFMGFIKSLGRGLASLAPIAVPMLIGAGAVAGVIAILGAGVAAAIALIGLSLPVFAKGLKEVAEIDGINLAKIALGLALLGPAMIVFTGSSVVSGLANAGAKIINFFSGGGPVATIKNTVQELTPVLPQLEKIGPALNSYSNGIIAFGKAINTVDIAKAEKLKEVMKGPGLVDSISAAAGKMVTATANLVTGQKGEGEKTQLAVNALNSTMKDLSLLLKEISTNTKDTVAATKSLSGNVW